MKRERRILLILPAIILLGMVIGHMLGPEKSPPRVEIPLTPDGRERGTEDVRPQTVSTRTWKALGWANLFELGVLPEDRMGDPVEVRTDSYENVYVLDWGDRCVRKFSSVGTPLQVYGGVSGRGPGEFSNPTALEVTPEGEVWVCDPVNGLVTVFADDGSVLKTIRTELPPHRIAHLGKSGFVVICSPAGEHLFHRYDADGRLVDTCGTLMSEQTRMGVILDGRCAGSSDGRFVYAGYRAGLLGVFNLAHTPHLFFAHTLEHAGLPRVLTQQNGDVRYVRVHPDAPLVSRSVSLVGPEIHVLTGFLDEQKKSVMDVYDHESGAYAYSYALPTATVSARRTDRRLYTIADTTVTAWQVEVENLAGIRAF